MNDFLTTEELLKRLKQQDEGIKPVHHVHMTASRKRQIKKIGSIIYWVILSVAVLLTISALIPIVFPHRAVNVIGATTMLAIPNDQELDQELKADIIRVKRFNFEQIKIGDRIIIYGKFGTDLYWVEEVVSIDAINQTLDTTFGYFIRNTYTKDQIIASFDRHTTPLSTVLYVATTIRGFISFILIETLVLGAIHYYFIRNPKQKK